MPIEEADQRAGGLPGGLDRGEEEHRGLEALATDGERGHDDDRDRAHGERLLQAAAQLGRRSMRAARRIQKIIQVTKPTATIDSVPPNVSCASNVSACSVRVEREGDARR